MRLREVEQGKVRTLEWAGARVHAPSDSRAQHLRDPHGGFCRADGLCGQDCTLVAAGLDPGRLRVPLHYCGGPKTEAASHQSSAEAPGVRIVFVSGGGSKPEQTANSPSAPAALIRCHRESLQRKKKEIQPLPLENASVYLWKMLAAFAKRHAGLRTRLAHYERTSYSSPTPVSKRAASAFHLALRALESLSGNSAATHTAPADPCRERAVDRPAGAAGSLLMQNCLLH